MKLKYCSIEYELKEILNESTFALPSFQRGLVWKDSKIKNFIQTLINGEPFGTLLVFKQNKKTYLIDGLQRVTAIRAFNEKPCKYLKPEVFEKSQIVDLIKIIKSADKRASNQSKYLEKRLVEQNIRKNLIKFMINNNFVSSKNTDALVNYLGCNLSKSDIVEINSQMQIIMDNIKNKIDISDLVVYGIEYKGKESRLPDVFYNINTGGTNLSKHDVLASLWPDKTYHINDSSIINKVLERYTALSDKYDMKKTITREQLEKDGVTLFDYCYAIGKMLYDEDEHKYYTFLGKAKKNETEPIGFSIISLILGLKENEARIINSKLENTTAKFLRELKNLIVDAFDHIYEGLDGWIISERLTQKCVSNKKNKKTIYEEHNYNYVDSKYMIYHMFMSYVKMNYEINLEKYTIVKKEDNDIDKWNEGFKTHLHIHYFYDYMTDYWDKHRQVSDLTNMINKESERGKYAFDISDDEWEIFFKKFKKDQLTETCKTFQPKTKLFLDYLIKFKILKDPELKTKYFVNKDYTSKKKFYIDIEHIVPKEIFKSKFSPINDNIESKIPVYSLGNACYLTAKLNRGKGSDTIYEFNKLNPTNPVEKAFIEFVTYPEEKELTFISWKLDIFKEKYLKFLEKRIDKLVNEFMENIQ